MTLRAWIEKKGPKEVAKLLKVDPATVSLWRAHRSLPRPRFMVAINRLSRGKVSYQQMVLSVVRASALKNK